MFSFLNPFSRSSKTYHFQFHDGGRQTAGFKGGAGDCVVRSIAIAANLPHHHEVGGEHAGLPEDQGRQIGQVGGEGGDGEEIGRVMPAVERVAGAEEDVLGGGVDPGVEGGFGVAGEDEAAGDPDLAEIGADRLARDVEIALGGGEYAEEDQGVEEDQGEAVGGRALAGEPGAVSGGGDGGGGITAI